MIYIQYTLNYHMSPIHSYIIHTFLLYSIRIYIYTYYIYCNLCTLSTFWISIELDTIAYFLLLIIYIVYRICMCIHIHDISIYSLCHVQSLSIVVHAACRWYKSEINSGVVKGAYGFWTNWWVLDESWWIRCPVWASHSVFSPNIFHFLSFGRWDFEDSASCGSCDAAPWWPWRTTWAEQQGMGLIVSCFYIFLLFMTVLPRFAYLRRRIFGSEIKADVPAANH